MENENDQGLPAPDELRRRAEERLQTTSVRHSPRSREAMRRLVHELEVHQVELEMQNEELRQARDELEKVLEKSAGLYDFAPIGYLTLDRNATISAVNFSGAGLLKVERSRLIGRRFGQFISGKYRPTFSAFLDKTFTGLSRETCEVALLNKGNPPLVVQIEAMAATTGQECRLALIDISGRRQTEDALREIEERMYRLAEIAVDAIVLLDDSGTITFCNTAAERMFGSTAAEIIGRDFHQLFIPERHLGAESKGFTRFTGHGTGPLTGRRTEVTALRKDGTEFTMELSISALELKGGWHAIGIMRDVSARRLLESEVQDAREYAENIVETVREPLVVLDSDLKILTVNHSFYETFKVTPEETIGNFIYDVGNQQWDIPKLRVLIEDILPKDTVINGYEVEHDFLDIGRKTILLNARQIFRKKIGSYIILLAMEDITERKCAEVELRHESTHDILTGLYNRAFFNEELERLARGRLFPLSIVMADVNGLKTVNDTLGHEAGDKLIRMAARIILGAFRAEDIVARIGGDEFVVLLPETDTAIAEEAVKRIKSSPEIIHGQVSIAFGIASAVQKDQLAEALRLSDERMYRDKSEQKEA